MRGGLVAIKHLFSPRKYPYSFAASNLKTREYELYRKFVGGNANALSYLIKTVEELQSTVKALQHKQASDSPKWMDIDELCAYLPSHPAKQTVYGWVSAKQIPVHKINKALAFLQSEIDDWLKSKVHKTQDDLMLEAEQFVKSKKIIR